MAPVLVIDDDEESRTLLRHMLARSGHQVEEAIDGREGLRMFEKRPAHVVITDINMPGMDGHEVITKPFEFAQLVGAVPRAIESRGAHADG